MSLIVARITGPHICIVSDTKLIPSGHEDIGLKHHPGNGIIKSIILNKDQCVCFAGNEYFADAALQEVEQGGHPDDVLEVLHRYHILSEYHTAFIFCFVDHDPQIVSIKDGDVTKGEVAWVGDQKAFELFQEYYHSKDTPISRDSPIIPGPREVPTIRNLRMTVNSQVPNDDFSKMSNAMDHVIHYYDVPSVGGFRIQVIHDGNWFAFTRYTNICNDVIEIPKDGTGRFGFSNRAKGSYNVNCAQGYDNYQYAAIHIREADLGILYSRKKGGLMRPVLYHLDLLDFADFIAQYQLLILVADEPRPARYNQRARVLFNKGAYFEAIHWLCQAIRFSQKNNTAYFYFAMGVCFHNHGRPMTAGLCFEHAISLDPQYKAILEQQPTRPIDEQI